MFHSEVAEGDDVHLVFLANSPRNIIYTKYSYASNSFGTETALENVSEGTYAAPVISRSGSQLYVFYPDYPTQDHIFYRRWNGANWEDRVDWIDEIGEGLNGYSGDDGRGVDTQSVFYQAYGGYIGLLYMTKTASPYNVKFALLTVAQVYEIYIDAVAKSLAEHLEQAAFNIEKDASVSSQATHAPETTFNITKDSIVQALASAVIEIVTGIIEIYKDAITTAQATFTLESAFNISPETVVKVLAEVSVVKEGEVKVTKLFLILGNLAIQIQGN
jgi:hypothetical protein